MLTKDECLEAIKEFKDSFMLHTPRFVTYHSPRFMHNICMIDQLIEEHFELIDKYKKLEKALDNAIKECCINVSGSDACNSLDELYEAFKKEVWENVE